MHSLPDSERALQRYVLERNVQHLQGLLVSEDDAGKLEMLRTLLASAERDLKRLNSHC
jgi:hypothetical protein